MEINIGVHSRVAAAIAWPLTESGTLQRFSGTLAASLLGGWIALMGITRPSLPVGRPAVLLLAPVMYRIAEKLGINNLHSPYEQCNPLGDVILIAAVPAICLFTL